jgi:oxalate decarboxylase/phosphoglucose isomerase-like protein (cupin superfamily)
MNVRHITAAFEDARGSIADILEDELIEHVSILTTVRGSVRGNHYHRETYQWVYIVSGKLRYVTHTDGGPALAGVVRAGDVLMTGPMESHAMEALEDTTMVVMTRGPRGGREYESDTFRLKSPLILNDVAQPSSAVNAS